MAHPAAHSKESMHRWEEMTSTNHTRTEEVSRQLVKQVEEISKTMAEQTTKMIEKEKELYNIKREHECKLADQKKDYEEKLANQRREYELKLADLQRSSQEENLRLRQELQEKQISLLREANKLNLTISALTVESREVPRMNMTLMEKERIIVEKDRMVHEKDKEILRLKDEVDRLRAALNARDRSYVVPATPHYTPEYYVKSDAVVPFSPAKTRPPPPAAAAAATQVGDAEPPVESVDDEPPRRASRDGESKIGSVSKRKAEGELLAAEAAKLANREERRKRKQEGSDRSETPARMSELDESRSAEPGDEGHTAERSDFEKAITALSAESGIVGRKEQLSALQSIWSAVSRGPSASAFVYGPPGSGKTCSVFSFAESMSRQARTTIVAKLNCRVEKNHAPKSVYIRLVEALAKVLASRRINVPSASEIHDPKANWFRVVGDLTDRHYQLIIVCDEVDSFTTETVLTLLEPIPRQQHVLVIGIANSLDMGAMVRSNPRMCDVKLIQYNPYTAEEMVSIARSRLESDRVGFVFTPEALLAAAKKEVRRKSDARSFLDLCRKALLVARDQRAVQVTHEHVDVATASLLPEDEGSNNLRSSHLTILVALLARSPKGGAVSVEAVKQAVDAMPGSTFANRTDVEWRGAVETLEMSSCVSRTNNMLTLRLSPDRVRRLVQESGIESLLTELDHHV